MDYAFLPPEINSARMYSGPGPNSMLVAAASWDALAAELASAAENYGSVIARLTRYALVGPGVHVDAGHVGSIRGMAGADRRADQADRYPSQSGGGGIRAGSCDDGAPSVGHRHPGCHRRRNGQCQQHRWHSTLTHSVLDQHDTVSAQM